MYDCHPIGLFSRKKEEIRQRANGKVKMPDAMLPFPWNSLEPTSSDLCLLSHWPGLWAHGHSQLQGKLGDESLRTVHTANLNTVVLLLERRRGGMDIGTATSFVSHIRPCSKSLIILFESMSYRICVMKTMHSVHNAINLEIYN